MFFFLIFYKCFSISVITDCVDTNLGLVKPVLSRHLFYKGSFIFIIPSLVLLHALAYYIIIHIHICNIYYNTSTLQYYEDISRCKTRLLSIYNCIILLVCFHGAITFINACLYWLHLYFKIMSYCRISKIE